MTNKCFVYILGYALLGCSVAASADCEVKSRSENVVLMQCSTDSSEDVLKESGQQACAEDVSCNVWFWGKDVALPESAPTKDSDLPKALTSQAIAVWVNDSESLLQLKKVK